MATNYGQWKSWSDFEFKVCSVRLLTLKEATAEVETKRPAKRIPKKPARKSPRKGRR